MTGSLAPRRNRVPGRREMMPVLPLFFSSSQRTPRLVILSERAVRARSEGSVHGAIVRLRQAHSGYPGERAQPLLQRLARVVELRALTAEASGHVPAERGDFGEDGSHLPVDQAVHLC